MISQESGFWISLPLSCILLINESSLHEDEASIPIDIRGSPLIWNKFLLKQKYLTLFISPITWPLPCIMHSFLTPKEMQRHTYHQSVVASCDAWEVLLPIRTVFHMLPAEAATRKVWIGATTSAVQRNGSGRCWWQGALWRWGREHTNHSMLLHFLYFCWFQLADTSRSHVHNPLIPTPSFLAPTLHSYQTWLFCLFHLLPSPPDCLLTQSQFYQSRYL